MKRHDRSAVAKFLTSCEPETVKVYGPYEPHRGRSKWRIQIWDPTTQRKKSLTADSRQEAQVLKAQVEREIAGHSPVTIHTAVAEYLTYKAGTIRSEKQVFDLGEKLRGFLPDVPIHSISSTDAHGLYEAQTQQRGKKGAMAAATHQGRLRLVKAFWQWMVRRGLATANPFATVLPIGKAQAGKFQLDEPDARKLDRHLFASADAGDEGALALLVELYLGLRTSEVLGLRVSQLDGHNLFVHGTKTKNARRKLAVCEPVAALLRRHCEGRQGEERIFAANLPSQPAPNWAYKRLKKHCAAAGVPDICPHSLRGMHSSLALEGGATSQNVASALGHASFATTARHYATPDSIARSKAKVFADAMAAHREADSVLPSILLQLPEDLRSQVEQSLRARRG